MFRKRFFFCLFLLFSFTLFAKEKSVKSKSKKQTVCLNMIVKNESKVIERCLKSLSKIIDHWIIVDTGSKDGTQSIIKKYMKNIPGKLYERPWKNFEHNRNEALKLAKGKADYILFIDADEQLVIPENFVMPELNEDSYLFTCEHIGTRYYRKLLVKDGLPWKWVGVLHEFLDCEIPTGQGILPGIYNIISMEGCRSSDPNKYYNDAMVLEKAVKKEPNNSRYQFYLGKSYRDCNMLKEAIMHYKKRIAMGGWDEEVYWCKYEIGKMLDELNEDPKLVEEAYLEAYRFRPSRIESIYQLANYYLRKNEHTMAYLIVNGAINTPIPNDILFVERWMYDFGMILAYIEATAGMGKLDEALNACNVLLTKDRITDEVKQLTEKNRILIHNALVARYRDSKQVDLITMRKSGTHLIEKFLQLLSATNAKEYIKIKEEVDARFIAEQINFPCGTVVRSGHIPYLEKFDSFRNGYYHKKIMMVRDPRDIIISASYFVPKIFDMKMQTKHPKWVDWYVKDYGTFLKKWDGLSINSKIASLINQEVPDSIYSFTPDYYKKNNSTFIPPFDYTYQFGPSLTYMKSPNTLVVRFEDLVGAKGGGSNEAQYKAMEQIAAFIGMPFNRAVYKRISKDLFGSSYTFRSGKSGAWKKHFSKENKKLFKDKYGKVLVNMGYEKDNSW